MVDASHKEYEDVVVDAKPTKESTVLTEEKLYASDVFRMHCFKVPTIRLEFLYFYYFRRCAVHVDF